MLSIPNSLSFSLPSTHTNTLLVILPLSLTFSPTFICFYLSYFLFPTLRHHLLSLWLYTHPAVLQKQSSQPRWVSRSFLLFSALPDLGLKWDSCKVIYPSPVKTKTRSESRRRNQLRATFHCLSFSYSLSQCKRNERVLHLINVAMHVDTCFPQPFLHCQLPIAVFAEITGTVSSLFECPLNSSSPSPVHFCYQNIYLCLMLLRLNAAVQPPTV